MIEIELKAVIVILLIISIIANFMTYKEEWKDSKKYLYMIEVSEGFFPKKRFFILLLISFCLFIYEMYLNTIPSIILF